jgi:hypothetical protein
MVIHLQMDDPRGNERLEVHYGLVVAVSREFSKPGSSNKKKAEYHTRVSCEDAGAVYKFKWYKANKAKGAEGSKQKYDGLKEFVRYDNMRQFYMPISAVDGHNWVIKAETGNVSGSR